MPSNPGSELLSIPPKDVIPAKAGTQSTIGELGVAKETHRLRPLNFIVLRQQVEACLGSRLRGNDGGGVALLEAPTKRPGVRQLSPSPPALQSIRAIPIMQGQRPAQLPAAGEGRPLAQADVFTPTERCLAFSLAPCSCPSRCQAEARHRSIAQPAVDCVLMLLPFTLSPEAAGEGEVENHCQRGALIPC